MLSAKEIVLEYVCPSLGLVIANFQYMAPLRDLQSAVTTGLGLGDLNPTPWAFMLGNCLGWLSYGVLISNWFVFWANYPGFLVACWLNLGAVKLMYASHHQDEARRSLVEYLSSSSLQQDENVEQQQSMLVLRDEATGQGEENDDRNNSNENIEDAIKTVDFGDASNTSTSSSVSSQGEADANPGSQEHHWAKIVLDVTSQKTTPAKNAHERLVLGVVIVWTVVLSAIGFYTHYYAASTADAADSESNTAHDVAQSILGYVANFNQIFFYGAPLSTIGRVLKTRRSDTLHVPTMVMNTSNAVFWTSYALAINDPYIYVPNGLGLIMCITLLVLWTIFPKTTTTKEESGGGSVTIGDSKHDHDKTTESNGNSEHDHKFTTMEASA